MKSPPARIDILVPAERAASIAKIADGIGKLLDAEKMPYTESELSAHTLLMGLARGRSFLVTLPEK